MPDNAGFYYAAYAVATGIYIIYGIMLHIRWSRVKAQHQNGDRE